MDVHRFVSMERLFKNDLMSKDVHRCVSMDSGQIGCFWVLKTPIF